MMTQQTAELADMWRLRVQEFRASGLSGPQWCAPRGFKVRQLHYWNRKFRAADAEAPVAEWITVPPTAASADADALQVTVGQAVITVPSGFSPALLQSVVRALAPC